MTDEVLEKGNVEYVSPARGNGGNNTQGDISCTYRPDGSLATRIVKDSRSRKTMLIQYSPEGAVTFVQELEIHYGKRDDVTYRADGTVSAIMKEGSLPSQGRCCTLYNEQGQVTTTIQLNKDDQVNFKDGYLSSVIKYSGRGLVGGYTDMDETQYGPDGKLLASTHKVRVSDSILNEKSLWLTTSETTYHSNGKKASTVTYKQMAKMSKGWRSHKTEEDKADSYRSSITQYDENGKMTVSVKLDKMDDVSFSGDRLSSVTRRSPEGHPISTTTYDINGSILSVQNYDPSSGKVVSTLNYRDGKPETVRQPTGQEYTDILSDKKKSPKTNVKKTLKEASLKRKKVRKNKGQQCPFLKYERE